MILNVNLYSFFPKKPVILVTIMYFCIFLENTKSQANHYSTSGITELTY